MKVLIVAESASESMSGEAYLPLYYFRRLLAAGVDVRMAVHARVRDELRRLFPDDEVFERITFVEDTRLQAWLDRAGSSLPARVKGLTVGVAVNAITQWHTRRIARGLVRDAQAEVIFQPIPISPKVPSFMFGLGAPVVIGPMAGGMDFPPAFRNLETPAQRAAIVVGRALAQVLNWVIPGKLRAAALIVSNERSRKALPWGCRGRVYRVRDGGVDLALWQPAERPLPGPQQPMRFVFMGRFVEQKGARYLVEAFRPVAERTNAVLEMIGAGEQFDELRARVDALQLNDRIRFHGWLPLADAARLIRECHVFVVPSIADPGNIAMMEAMATGMPEIATTRGGVAEVPDASCGLLVEPTSPEALVAGFSEAMLRLASDPVLCARMGVAATARMRTNYFDWDSKIRRVIEIFEEVLEATRPRTTQDAGASVVK